MAQYYIKSTLIYWLSDSSRSHDHLTSCNACGCPAEATPDDGEGAWWYLTDPDQGLSRMGWGGKQLEPGAGICAKGAGLFGGVHDDFRRRMPRYWKDIRQVRAARRGAV